MSNSLLFRSAFGFLFSLAALFITQGAKGQDNAVPQDSLESVGTEIIAQGTFNGKSGHRVIGGVTLRKTEKGILLELASGFRFDGAPDPKLALGKDGYDSATLFSALQSNMGRQVYLLPESIDPAANLVGEPGITLLLL